MNTTIASKFSIDNPDLLNSIPASIIAQVREAEPSMIISDNYPYRQKMKRAIYENEKQQLQIELIKLQHWMKEKKRRLVIIFEGRDAAGKGGTIKRFMEHLNPRGARIVALEKPTSEEAGQWYFQRYVKHLPTAGEIVFFDRSWYNRAGVEYVMGFCTPDQYTAYMEQAPEFERMLVQSGIRIVKFWFSVSRQEQLRRFLSRAEDPLKQWKLSEMDYESLGRWQQYTKAKESMFFSTDTHHCPWLVIRSDDKKRARLNAMRYVLNSMDYDGKDYSNLQPVDPLVLGSAEDIYEPDEILHREKLVRRKRRK